MPTNILQIPTNQSKRFAIARRTILLAQTDTLNGSISSNMQRPTIQLPPSLKTIELVRAQNLHPDNPKRIGRELWTQTPIISSFTTKSRVKLIEVETTGTLVPYKWPSMPYRRCWQNCRLGRGLYCTYPLYLMELTLNGTLWQCNCRSGSVARFHRRPMAAWGRRRHGHHLDLNILQGPNYVSISR